MTVIINGTTGISGVDGSAGTPAVQGTDTNTGVFYPAADTVAVSTGGSERMRVDSSGNVGIGTSSPASKLEVAGYTNITTGGIKVSGSVTGYTNEVSLGGTTVDSSYAISTTGTGTPNMFFDHRGTGNTGTFSFRVGTGGGTERMRIDSSGNVLVGSPSSTSKLSVYATGATTPLIRAESSAPTSLGQSGQFNAKYSGTDRDWYFGQASDGTFGIWDYPGGSTTKRMTLDQSGNLTITGSTATKASGTTWANPSDIRLKDNIQNYTKGLSELMQVNVKTWEYNGKGGTTKGMKGLGVIADEIMTVLPDTIEIYEDKLNADDEENTAIKKFDATEITWLLVKTVQEQQALITALTERITALENK